MMLVTESTRCLAASIMRVPTAGAEQVQVPKPKPKPKPQVRSCVGYPLARLNLVSALAQLYGNFTFELAPEVRRKPGELCFEGWLRIDKGETGPPGNALYVSLFHGLAGY